MNCRASRRRHRRNRHSHRPRVLSLLSCELLEARQLLDGALAHVSSLLIDPEAYEPSSILVRFQPQACSVSACPITSVLGDSAELGRQLPLLPELREVTLGQGASLEASLAALRSNPSVVYAEPNYRVHLAETPNDPRFDELWGLNNDGQTGGTPDADIDMLEAWQITTGSGDTLVAVIDTGVDFNHEDLAANMWINPGEVAGDGLDNDGNGYVDDIHGYDFFNRDGSPMDDNNHGTHVAGTIAAVGSNGIGVSGVNWNAQIMALKFLDASGNGSIADAIEAIDYAVANGATISNNSWGFNGGFSQALYDAIASARDADHVFLSAAGNGNIFGIGQNNDTTPFYPSSYDLENIISVAASDHNDDRAIFSNYGASSVDLAAPGVNILSTTRNDTYSSFNGTSMATPHVAGVVALIRDLNPDWTYQQVVNQVLLTVDPAAAFEGITVTGGRMNAWAAVAGAATPAPEIQVQHSGTSISDDTGIVDFENTPPGYPITYTFTVKNQGTAELTLQEPIHVPPGYSVSSSFGATTLATGESTTFALRLDAATEGSYSGEVSFGNNDEDENPFNFTVTGTVSIPPAVEIIDNGDPDFATSGAWTEWTGQGFQDDVHESLAGTGSDVASWTFDRLLPGTYRVAATWSEYTNRATNSPFTILDDGSTLGTVAVNQQLAPDGFADAGAVWKQLGGTWQITSGALVVELSDAANGRVNADAIRIERLPPTAEIQVLDGTSDVPDGTGTVEFGSTELGTPLAKTFVVKNLGAQVLTLSDSITVPAGFSLLSGFGTTTLSTDETTTFTIQLDATSDGSYSGTVEFDNSDDDENPFDFTVSGTVDPPPAVQIIDNGDVEFATVGEWTLWNGQGYLNDIHESLPGSGSDVASWTFANLLPGTYQVSATWSAFSNRATNSPFTILDDTTELGTVQLNQRLAPDDFSDAGANWENLGGTYQIDSGTLVVQLNDAADGRLNADAIRIERIPPAPEIQVLDGATDIPDDTGSIDYGSTAPGVTLTRTFTVQNAGAAALTLDPAITVPDGYTLTAGFGETTLQPGQLTTFDVRFDATAEGTFSGAVSFGNNDQDENPFNFSVTATVAVPPPVQIIDNGNAGFATVGEWTLWTGQGYQNDIHESLAGSGADVASWTFQGLLSGSYRVSATWSEFTNRATNAPFTISDDTTPLATVLVNQQQAPSDFSEDGANWEDLGSTYDIASGTLVVKLTDAANGRLNADAIRIERLPEAPEIQVLDGTADVPDGSGSVDYGSTLEGTSVTKTFTVKNVGTQTLTLVDSITVPAGFSVASGFGTTTLGPAATTTFSIRLDATSAGSYSGPVEFANSDADENPFDFTVSGTVDPAPSVQIIDNGDAGFTTVGQWRRWTGQGYLNDIHESMPGSGSDVASWTFTNVAAGTYQVSATWSAFRNRASDSPFTILDDATQLATVTVNQQIAPNDFADAGANWEILGGTYQINSGTLVVQLSDDADGRLNADAIRIERVAQANGATSASSALQLGGAVLVQPTYANIPSQPDRDRHDASPGTEIQLEGSLEATFYPPSLPASEAVTSPADGVFANWPSDELDDALLDALTASSHSRDLPAEPWSPLP